MAQKAQVAIEFVGLSEWDQQLLRSLFKLVAGRTSCDWVFDVAAPQTVVIMGEIEASPSHVRAPVIRYLNRMPVPADGPYALQAPIKPQVLIETLSQVERALAEQEAARQTPWSLLQWLDSLIRRGSSVPQRITKNDQEVAYIDFSRRVWLLYGDETAWTEAALGQATLLARPATPEQCMALDWSSARGLNELIWRVTQISDRGLLPRVTGACRFRLVRWPDFTQQSDWRAFVAVASALQQQTLPFTELLTLTRGGETALIAWLNAGVLSGCIEAVFLPQQPIQPDAAASPTLLRRLRQKLRLQ